MSRIFFYSLIPVLALISACSVFAATDSFTVRTLVGDDTTPPSIPGNLTATPVATSQIDLAWDPSTDDFIFGGYQVYRDNVQIATTTLTSYSDVGLTPSTTYAYYITAFDAALNYSASSTVVATTTLASTTPPAPTSTPTTTTSGGGGDRIELVAPGLELVSLEVIPDTHSVLIRYETAGYARTVVRWGKTTSYELGSLAERSFARLHETRISGLQPGTRYWFTIEGENHVGLFGVLTVSSFRTLEPLDTVAPANVENLRAWREGDDILLAWDNPADPDFDRVRVLRNDRFFPYDTQDGWIVYEDSGESARDRGAALPGTTQYYTVFSYDALGNVSSGAIVGIRILDGGGTEIIEPDEIIDETANEIDFSFRDLEFVQDGELLEHTDDRVLIDGTKNLTIRIPYEALPEHLKSILITLADSENPEEIFSFLLRIDAAKEYYTATLAPLGTAGVFPLRLAIFDFKTQQVGYTKGSIVSTISFMPTEAEREGFLAYLFSLFMSKTGIFSLSLIFLLGIILFIARRLLAHNESIN